MLLIEGLIRRMITNIQSRYLDDCYFRAATEKSEPREPIQERVMITPSDKDGVLPKKSVIMLVADQWRQFLQMNAKFVGIS